MHHQRLGRTDLNVSRICLGCMSFGTSPRAVHQWTIGEDAARAILRGALDLGINFFDTANVYGRGLSEEILGRAVRDLAARSEVVLATKVGLPMGRAPAERGLSKAAIIAAAEESLRRLQTDYIDLYIIHRPDPKTPMEETLQALDALVEAGKVRWLGVSSMPAGMFREMLDLQRANGLAEFATMQNYYNLLYREEEREMIPLCLDRAIAVTPWSPLARGKLARSPGAETERSRSDPYNRQLLDPYDALDAPVLAALDAVARRRGVPRARIALAWLLGKAGVAAPVLGTTRLAQLEDGCAATELSLNADEIEALEAAYVSHPEAVTRADPTRN